MKNKVLSSLLLLSLGFTACDKGPWDADEIRAELQGSTYEVVFFQENGSDLSNDFRNIRLEFQDNRDVRVRESGDSWRGSWRVRNSSSDATVELKLDLPSNNSRLRRLDDDWYLVDRSRDRLDFIDDDDDARSLSLRRIN